MLHLEASGEGEVKASDIEETNKVEIVNPDLHIATINSDANFKMSMRVTAGRGYVPAERNKIEDDPEGTIAIDSVFSPIKRVNYEVENTRVGQRTDLDRLILRVETDGSMTVKEAIQKAAAMLYTHIQVFLGEEKQADVQMVSHSDEDTSKLREILEKGVDELELPSRAHNCLKSANIHTLGDLVRNTESEMLKYKNFGKKSLDELKEILQGYGIDFGMDVDAIIGEKKETT
jgi:DNA-directed RNA polymerase subunit alpha